jgi:hypothetical protein
VGVVITVVLIVVAVFIVVAGIFPEGFVALLLPIWEDHNNRNDRGRLKRPSDKYVSR